ncbi:MAG: TonB-dependent receptor plug domain-containing protein [bacterium]
MRAICFCFFLVVLYTACASTGPKTTRSKKSANVISVEEIAKTTAQNAYEVIQRLRPGLLIARGMEPTVYLDNMKQGRLSSLYNIYASDIEEIKYLSPNEATLRFGTGNIGGAFLIKTKSN